jgi:hypothetical protein
LGYWTFDGGSVDWRTNTVADMSGQGNTGSLISMSTSSSTVAGRIGQAMNFNGTTQYINVGNSSTLNPTSAITVAVWLYPTVYAHAIVGRDNNAGNDSIYAFKWRQFGTPWCHLPAG